MNQNIIKQKEMKALLYLKLVNIEYSHLLIFSICLFILSVFLLEHLISVAMPIIMFFVSNKTFDLLNFSNSLFTSPFDKVNKSIVYPSNTSSISSSIVNKINIYCTTLNYFVLPISRN